MTGTAHCTCATCGKSFGFPLESRWDAWNPSENLARKIAWAEGGGISECPACREARHTQETAAAQAEADAACWPELTGTEKQVAWATSLRKTGLKEMLRVIFGTDNEEDMLPTAQFAADSFREYIASTQTTAKWWIDNRSNFSYIPFVEPLYNLWVPIFDTERPNWKQDLEVENEKAEEEQNANQL